MKIFRNILMIVGILAILLNIPGWLKPADLGGISDASASEIEAYRLGQRIGGSIFAIFGSLLLFTAFMINRKIKKKKTEDLIDSFGQP